MSIPNHLALSSLDIGLRPSFIDTSQCHAVAITPQSHLGNRTSQMFPTVTSCQSISVTTATGLLSLDLDSFSTYH